MGRKHTSYELAEYSLPKKWPFSCTEKVSGKLISSSGSPDSSTLDAATNDSFLLSPQKSWEACDKNVELGEEENEIF